MQSVEYRIIAYADSETVANGTDLLVLLRLPYGAGPCLRAYIVDKWQSAITAPDELVIQYIEDVLFDVRRNVRKDGPEIDAFFEALNELNVGPLRTSALGSCDVERLENLHLLSREQTREIFVCSPDAFLSLRKALLGLDHQLQAARS